MNLDHFKVFYNQSDPAEHDASECIDLTLSLILANKLNQPVDPDFGRAAYFKLTGKTPDENGIDLHGAMLAIVKYGILPTTEETFTARSTNELYISNPANYSQQQYQHAAYYAQNGTKYLPTKEQITDWLFLGKSGVPIVMRWYASYSSPNADGTLRMPQPGEPFTFHSVPFWEKIDGAFRFTPHLGANYGDHGYGYMPPEVFDASFLTAEVFDPNANRNISLLWVRLYQLQYLFSIIQANYAK